MRYVLALAFLLVAACSPPPVAGGGSEDPDQAEDSADPASDGEGTASGGD